MAEVHGGRLVAEALRRNGVQYAFTLCGGHVQAIYEGCVREGIRLIDTRHEHTTVAAAEGVGRITGRPGVAIVTAGPGATNVVTAMASAARAQIPLVCLAGAGPQSLKDMGALADLDGVMLMRPLCKWATRVTETQRLMEYIDTAFNRAQAGVPGPVYLELPLDVLMGQAPATPPRTAPLAPIRPAPDASAIEQVAELLRRAGRPTLLVGSQLNFSSAQHALQQFAERVEFPIYLNGLARGLLPPTHPCLLSRTRRSAMRDSDLILLLGTPLDFRLGYGRSADFNPEAKVVQVDLDPSELGKNRAVDVALNADTGLTLQALGRVLGEKRCPEWLAGLSRAEAEAEAEANPSELSSRRIYEEVAARLQSDDLLIADGGDFATGAVSNIYLTAPQKWLDAAPFGALGMGPGYAMAAALARPGGRAVAFFGDGAIGFHLGEFEAMARQGLRVLAIVGNDGGWSQERRAQRQLYELEQPVATRLSHARYDKVVSALGGQGYWVEQSEELGPALDEAFGANVPACVNVKLPQAD